MGLISQTSDLAELDVTTDGDDYWYLASPYSNLPRTDAFLSAAEAAAWLIGNGVRVYSPITHSHPIARYGKLDAGDLDLWLRVDKPFMQHAKGMIVLQLPLWGRSEGIRREVAAFAETQKPIHYMRWPIH